MKITRNVWLRRIVVFCVFVGINILFQWFDWTRVIRNENLSYQGTDYSMSEFNIESVYQQIKSDQNLFVFEGRYVYPYTINISLSDPGVSNLVWYYPLRTWFSSAQTVRLIMIVNTLLASCLMYLFLHKLRVKSELAMLLALIFAYASAAPFRNLGHYTYTAIYIFPLGAWMLYKWGETKKKIETIMWALLAGLYGAFVLMLNFYYFIGIAVAVSFAGIYCVLKNQLTNKRAGKIAVSLLTAAVIMMTLLIPWIKAVEQFVKIESQVPVNGFAGANELSGDLLGILMPSESHLWYQKLRSIFPWEELITQNSDHSIYLSILFLVGVVIVVINFRRLSGKIRREIVPYGLMAIFFGALLFGPFLKVAGKIAVNLEGVSVVIPMPFLILHYLPGMESLRAPTRFFPLAVFFLVVIIGLSVTEWIRRLPPDKWKKWVIALGCVILVEIYTVPLSKNTLSVPSDLYDTIGNDLRTGTILEIPFVVRDGFEYLGAKDSISFQNGSLRYNKPVLGGYFARLHPDIFSYYRELYFVGNVLRLLDGKRNDLSDLDIERVKRELDFLDVRYLMLRQNESYSKVIQTILSKLPTKLVRSGQDFSLYEIDLKQENYDIIKLGQIDDNLFAAQGLGSREDGYRAIVQAKAKIFWKTKEQTKSLAITSSSETVRRIKVYLGETLLEEINVGPEKKTYKWELGSTRTGIQIITFVIENLRRGEIMNNENGVKIYEYGAL